jgi:hypothetical protein
MSASKPDDSPQPEPKRSGGPPKPPEKTARGLEDGSAGGGDDVTEMVRIVTNAQRVSFLLTNIRGGAQWMALNVLEDELGEAVLELRKLHLNVRTQDRDLVLKVLQDIRDYRRRYPLRAAGNKALWKEVQEVLDSIE